MRTLEIVSETKLGRVELTEQPHCIEALYYVASKSATGWVFDRRTEMGAAWDRAIMLATAIVNAPPRIGRR